MREFPTNEKGKFECANCGATGRRIFGARPGPPIPGTAGWCNVCKSQRKMGLIDADGFEISDDSSGG